MFYCKIYSPSSFQGQWTGLRFLSELLADVIYLMCHQSSVCSSTFSLKRFIHHSTAPLSVVVCSSVRHFSAGARFSHLIGFYHHFTCEVTGVPGVISEGGLNTRRPLSRERRKVVVGGGRFISIFSSSFVELFSLSFFFFSNFYYPFSLAPLFVVAGVLLCVNLWVCVLYTTGGSDLSLCLICHPH